MNRKASDGLVFPYPVCSWALLVPGIMADLGKADAVCPAPRCGELEIDGDKFLAIKFQRSLGFNRSQV